MKKIIGLFLWFLLCLPGAFCQTDPNSVIDRFIGNFDPAKAEAAKLDTSYWSYDNRIEFTLALHGVSNWFQTNNNYIQGQIYANLNANYNREYILWTNQLEVRLGLRWEDSKNLAEDARNLTAYNNFLKIESNFGYKAIKRVDFGFNIRLQTQIVNGYKNATAKESNSSFMAPGYLDLGLGGTYTNPKQERLTQLTASLFPINSNIIFVLNDRLADLGTAGVRAAYTDDNGVFHPGQKVLVTWGARARVDLKLNLLRPKLSFENNLSFFVDYVVNPGDIQMDNRTAIKYNFNKLISIGLVTNLRYYSVERESYDYTVVIDGQETTLTGLKKPKLQVMSDLGITFSLNF